MNQHVATVGRRNSLLTGVILRQNKTQAGWLSASTGGGCEGIENRKEMSIGRQQIADTGCVGGPVATDQKHAAPEMTYREKNNKLWREKRHRGNDVKCWHIDT